MQRFATAHAFDYFCARKGVEVAKNARKDFEKRSGLSIISPEKAIDHIQSPEELPFTKPEE